MQPCTGMANTFYESVYDPVNRNAEMESVAFLAKDAWTTFWKLRANSQNFELKLPDFFYYPVFTNTMPDSYMHAALYARFSIYNFYEWLCLRLQILGRRLRRI